MLVYRDMTFCPFHEKCLEGKTCRRALTKSVKEEAEKIGLPISQFIKEPKCLKADSNQTRRNKNV